MLMTFEQMEQRLSRADNLMNQNIIDIPSERELSKFDGMLVKQRKKRCPPIPDFIKTAAGVAGKLSTYEDAAAIFGISKSVVNRSVSGYLNDNTRNDEHKSIVQAKVEDALKDVRAKAIAKLELIINQVDEATVTGLSARDMSALINSLSSAVNKTAPKQDVRVNVSTERTQVAFGSVPRNTESQYESVLIES